MLTNRTLKALERQIAVQRRRGDDFKTKLLQAKHQIVLMRRKLDERFCEGSAQTMAAVYKALPTDDAAIALSQLMMASRVKKPPFNLSPEVEEAARREAIAVLQASGFDFDGDSPAVFVQEYQL
jgi:hypothetical protein